MDDKFIYYLIIGAIYLVSRMLKKKKPPTPVSPPSYENEDLQEFEEPVTQRPATPKPSSFEDLLKEISQGFEGRKEPQPATQVVEPVEIIEKPTPDELTREQKYVQEKKKEVKEETKRKSLLRLADEENEHKPHAVLELLQEEGGVANAVVLSEIMNRRF